MSEPGEDVVRMLVRDYREAWLLKLGAPLGVGAGAVALLFGCSIEHSAALAIIVACVLAMAGILKQQLANRKARQLLRSQTAEAFDQTVRNWLVMKAALDAKLVWQRFDGLKEPQDVGAFWDSLKRLHGLLENVLGRELPSLEPPVAAAEPAEDAPHVEPL